MATNCPICGEKIGMLSKAKTSDGVICTLCSFICSDSATRPISEIEKYWNINHERWEKFSATQELNGFASETITIDDANGFFVFGDIKKVKREPVVFSFDEVDSYDMETVGGKTVTKKKGGITRAVVGGVIAGPVGALVGSGTAKEETKTVGGKTNIKVHFVTYAGKKTRESTIYPAGFTAFLDRCITESEAKTKAPTASAAPNSAADEILKFKGLLDAGIITSEEFAAKKKELLGL